MIEQYRLMLEWVFSFFDKIIVMYFAGGIFSIAFGIYILRKISKIFDHLR